MKLTAGILALGLLLSTTLASAQDKDKDKAEAQSKAAPAPIQHLPPFSGTWILNLKHSRIEGDRPAGTSKAIIQYDGKNWRYIHMHIDDDDQIPQSWETRLVVGSPVFHVEHERPLTFRSRIARQGDALVMTEYVRTDRGQQTSNTVRYTLEDDGNTLIELEQQKGPLGTETNRWVLERQGAAAPASARPED
jgi:hypothetical protein